MHNVNDNISGHIKELPLVPTPQRTQGFIRLDLNESPCLFPEEALENITLTRDVIGHYPAYDDLKEKLAVYSTVQQQNVTVYNGSDAAISSLLNLFFHEGDTVVLPEPTFFIYRQILMARKVTIRSVPIEDDSTQVTFPTDRVLKAIADGVKGVLLCNPTNPIGISIPQTELETIIERAAAANTLVVIDEAYFEFYGKSFAAQIDKYPNVMILRTLSKGFGLAGLRIGYSITHPDITEHIRRIQLPWSASSISTMIAELILDDYQDIIESSRHALLARKATLEQHLQTLGIDYVPSSTNFLLLKLPDADAFAEAMLKKKIIVGKTYKAAEMHPVLANTVRITVSSEEDRSYVTEAIEKSYAEAT